MWDFELHDLECYYIFSQYYPVLYNIPNQAMSLKIISCNLEYGGQYIKTNRVGIYVEMIKKYNPDIVCFQEISRYNGDDTALKICKVFGWYYVKNSYACISIMSKYRIIKKHIELNYTNVLGITVDVDGCLMSIYNLHLNDQPGTPTTIKGIEYPGTPFITDVKQAVNMSFSTKRDDLIQLIKSIKRNQIKKIVIVGDFNEPSHLDDKIPWKCSIFLKKCGFVDSVRYLSSAPLLTYNTYNTEPYPKDRIDLVYHRCIKPIQQKLIPNRGLSDHRPVLVKFSI